MNRGFKTKGIPNRNYRPRSRKNISRACTTNETGYKSVSYIALVPVLLEGIKDLQKQLDVKNKDIDYLKKEFLELKAQVNNYHAMNK